MTEGHIDESAVERQGNLGSRVATCLVNFTFLGSLLLSGCASPVVASSQSPQQPEPSKPVNLTEFDGGASDPVSESHVDVFEVLGMADFSSQGELVSSTFMLMPGATPSGPVITKFTGIDSRSYTVITGVVSYTNPTTGETDSYFVSTTARQ